MNASTDTAKKAYDAYRKVAQHPYTHVTTTQLNVIYNILCRINRDEEYAKALESFSTVEGDSIKVLIEKYFEGYNNLHGLDIRETLTEFLDPDFAEGAYFLIKTFKTDCDGNPVEFSPVDFKKGEVATVKATLYSHSNNSKIEVERLRAVWVTEDGKCGEELASNTGEIVFPLSLSREGGVKFKIFAEDGDGRAYVGFETAYGGLLFSKEEILPTHTPPKDLVAFWCSEIDRMIATDPTSRIPDGYSGEVKYLHDMPKKNFYKSVKLDKDYLDMMRKNAQPTVADTALDKYDLWDVNLKSPGPCPSTAYVSVPKFVLANSLPIKFIFDGYSVRCPAPMISESCIMVHCSHHGYELGKSDKEYYEPVRAKIAGNYGRANGEVNSGYDNIHDCYMTYLLIRDLQMVRFVTDPSLSYDLPEIHDKWNGEIMISGGSMGGYQTVCVGALTTLLKKVSPRFTLTSLIPTIPAFCDIAGETDGRIDTDLTTYTDGCDYFDPALLAHLIDAPMSITRVGLGDETCPASGIMAMFNSVPKGIKKEMNFLQNSSHGYLPDVEFQDWYKYEER